MWDRLNTLSPAIAPPPNGGAVSGELSYNVGLAIKTFSAEKINPDAFIVRFNADRIQFESAGSFDLSAYLKESELDMGDFQEEQPARTQQRDSFLRRVLCSIAEMLCPGRNRQWPPAEVEFYDVRDETPSFGFSFFTFEILKAVLKHSDEVLLSGAYIRPGTKGYGDSDYANKKYFTLKMEGDMRLIQEVEDAVDPLFSMEELINDYNNSGPGAIFQQDRTEDFDPDIWNRTEVYGLPATILGHPCPPHWEFPSLSTDVAFYLMQRNRLANRPEGLVVLLWHPDPPSGDPSFYEMDFFQYLELVRLDWIRFSLSLA